MLGYAATSGLCVLLNNAVLILMDRAGAPLTLSIAASFAMVVAAGYALHSLLSFRAPVSLAAFGRYALAMSANVPLAFATVWLWRDAAGLRMEWAAPLATGCAALANFALCRWAIAGRPAPAPKSWVGP